MKPTFYIYAGYYELYISTEPMNYPYTLQAEYKSINQAINYCESIGDHIIYCESVKDYLPDYLYEYLQDNNYQYFKQV